MQSDECSVLSGKVSYNWAMENKIKEKRLHICTYFISTIFCRSVWTKHRRAKLQWWCDELWWFVKRKILACVHRRWLMGKVPGQYDSTQGDFTGTQGQFVDDSWTAYIQIKLLRKPQNECESFFCVPWKQFLLSSMLHFPVWLHFLTLQHFCSRRYWRIAIWFYLLSRYEV